MADREPASVYFNLHHHGVHVKIALVINVLCVYLYVCDKHEFRVQVINYSFGELTDYYSWLIYTPGSVSVAHLLLNATHLERRIFINTLFKHQQIAYVRY